ncbi:hypothetical protein ACFQDG_08795 [Natronoarchaeum mannanilyticum]|uniref:Outer membrane lipoprotein-sorting protein n=1 Tax=Natronoarchaeum mannanilyticum TaxID=926360 RepID=A0AAV3T7V3_9EURY
MRRQIALVAVVALVALAGCGGVLTDGGATDSPDDGSANESEPDQAPTLESVAYPDGYDRDGISNASRALSTHDAAISEAAGYELSATMRVDSGDETQELVMTSTVDNEAGTEFSTLELSGSVAVYRAADGSTYTRIDDGSNVQYESSQPDSYARLTMSQFESSIADANLSATSVSREGSTTLITYSGDAGIELVVDTEGRIHSLTIEEGDVRADFAFDYGSVTVEEPDWLDKAKNETAA